MFTALIILHVLVAFIMVGVILLQSGKGAEIGAAFGGSSQTIFGARGANTFLGKLTAVAATIFMLTSLSLAIMSKQRNYSSTIGLDKPPASAPAAPSPASDTPTPTQSSPAPVPTAPTAADPANPPSSPAPTKP
ncbi:MAG: preprotein translocase subunit SecG [Nitrospirae bacterium]|nr:MAG: preprotein translocase subunit SecG [Nitrospirota bacterium]